MSDWAPGDLALCVKSGTPCEFCGCVSDAKAGGVYTVSEVGQDDLGAFLLMAELDNTPVACAENGDVWLHFGENASRFRKIRPHTPDAEDRETIRLLNGVPVGEPA